MDRIIRDRQIGGKQRVDRIRDREIDRQDCTQGPFRGWIESEIDRQTGRTAHRRQTEDG